MSLRARIGRLERLLGEHDGPRRINVWYGTHLAESWMTRDMNGSLDFNVKTPGHDAHPVGHLTPEMREAIRPEDRIVCFMLAANPRDAHLQLGIPPWKRRPFRLDPDGRGHELQGEDGVWRRDADR